MLKFNLAQLRRLSPTKTTTVIISVLLIDLITLRIFSLAGDFAISPSPSGWSSMFSFCMRLKYLPLNNIAARKQMRVRVLSFDNQHLLKTCRNTYSVLP